MTRGNSDTRDPVLSASLGACQPTAREAKDRACTAQPLGRSLSRVIFRGPICALASRAAAAWTGACTLEEARQRGGAARRAAVLSPQWAHPTPVAHLPPSRLSRHLSASTAHRNPPTARMLRLLVLLLSALSSCSAFALRVPSRPAVAACATAHRAAPPIAKEKKDVLELEGVVLEALPGANFRVQLDDTEQVILAHVSGKIRKNFIKILVGDHVTCEISPYDLTKGRITFRRR